MSESDNGSENVQSSSGSSGIEKGNKCYNTIVKRHNFPNVPQISPSSITPSIIKTQPGSKYQAPLIQSIHQDEKQIILPHNQIMNQNLDSQIVQSQMNLQQNIQEAPNEIILQENNGHFLEQNNRKPIGQLNQNKMQILNQMNLSQNNKDKVTERKKSKKISIVNTEAINSLTEKIDKLTQNIGSLVEAQKGLLNAQKESLKVQNELLNSQKELLKKQDNIYKAILTYNQYQVNLITLLTKKFFPEEKEIINKFSLMNNNQLKINK